MAGWDTLRRLIECEFAQSKEEGRDAAQVEALRPQWQSARDEADLIQVWDALVALPIRADFGFEEPNDLEDIRRLRPQNARALDFRLADVSDERLFDQMHGAWLGRCAGCALGKPVEGFMGSKDGLSSWQRQKRYLTAISPDEWPLRDFFPGHSPAETETGSAICPASTREQIAFMESDDDIRYTVLGQRILQGEGRDFSSFDVARAWISMLPYSMVCTAETQAYRNLVWRTDFHVGSGEQNVDWDWVASFQNPYREWIGAQIRVDSYGYAAPGNMELAAEFAYRDARVSHLKNGIYGAMFCAAMIAAAFASSEPRAVVEAGLSQIPRTSRLYAELGQTIEICDQYGCDFAHFEAVIEEIYALLGHYDPVHTNNNAALCVAALLVGGGDFHRSVTLAVMGGLDSDCNGATVGSILGAMHGAKALPQHWIGRLNDTLLSEIIGYHPISLSECAQRSAQIARAVAS